MGRVRAMGEVVSSSISRPRFYMVLLGSFAVLALLPAHAGVYGLAAYSSSERLYQFGIRIALGASGGNIRLLLLVEGVVVIGCRLVAGVVGAMGLMRYLESAFYGIDPYDPTVLADILFPAVASIGLAC